MAQDWKDMLASLAGDLPPGDSGDTESGLEEKAAAKTATSQSLHIVLDRKGRKGKVATIIEGFTLPDDEVEQIASDLKRKIGTGGSARGGEILLQGDWRDKAAILLREKGYNVKN